MHRFLPSLAAPAIARALLAILPATVVLATIGNTAAAAPLSQLDRDSLIQAFDSRYDSENAGWGTQHKYVDPAAIEWSLAAVDDGDQTATAKVRRTLDANLHLIDPVSGSVSQADDLRMYLDAYSRWHRKTDLVAAEKIYGYLTQFLAAPDGGFYVSQGSTDKHEYSREAGWAIRALCKYYDVTGDVAALKLAERGARWVQSARSLPGGGFSHASETAGPLLDDNVSMTQAFIALYRSTGAREWLRAATGTIDFIDAKLRDPRAGYRASPAAANGHGVLREPIRDVAQNAALVRAANMLGRYTDGKTAKRVAQHAMTFLSAYAAANRDQYQPDILLADRELSVAPIHITIVGGKSDPAAQMLHATALGYPSDYLQVDWWDRQEGKLPNPTITYPVLEKAAAFACTANTCSTPVFEASELLDRVRSALN